jgi:MoxR-like ATPase
MNNQNYKFQSNYQLRPQETHPDSPQEPEPYIASPELIKAVNLAIYLRRPLLIEGEAGCGKTRLASAVAYELGLPYYRWNIRSTTKAQEGLYEYNAILRLHDVQTQKVEFKTNQGDLERNPSNPEHYRTFGAIGKAFRLQECPAVVLIDEIDKADVDFPNDLLTVLDNPWAFEIRETGETGTKAIKAAHKPIVIISSNKEKGNLPAPFLRRCLYYFMRFPSKAEELQDIVNKHYEVHQEDVPPENLVKAATERFLEVRQDKGLFKLPGTSELLDWLKALNSFDNQLYPNHNLTKEAPIPYRELLFKIRQDWQKYGSDPST